MVQALHNLLHNAIHYTPAGGAITIRGGEIESAGRRWIFCAIEDDGPGFAHQDLAAVFEPFFSRRSGGTGLGLSIVQRIVELHGGRVTASNREEGGARLTVELPVLC
jgi:signal transduction histidine kinase